jgi:hypothetical protein
MRSTDKRHAKQTPPPLPPKDARDSEYAHSSGDRNTRTDEDDWTIFKDGKQRTEHADSERGPSGESDKH